MIGSNVTLTRGFNGLIFLGGKEKKTESEKGQDIITQGITKSNDEAKQKGSINNQKSNTTLKIYLNILDSLK
jgi:hypothetical protein